MQEKLTWAKATYQVTDKDGEKEKFTNVACFSALRDMEDGSLDTIEIYSINCKSTLEYKEDFLQYIIDMLGLKDAEFDKNKFTFKAHKCNRINLLIASMVRFLVENIGAVNVPDIETKQLLFIKNVLNEAKYKDKLMNFCYHYKQIGDFNYFRTIHSWMPSNTKLKKTKQFIELEKLKTVNEFFEKE